MLNSIGVQVDNGPGETRKKSKKVWAIIGCMAGVLVILGLLLWFVSTRPLHISGKLLGTGGASLKDGTYDMRVRLFDVVNNSNLVFDQKVKIAVKDTKFDIAVKPPKNALQTPNLAVICLYGVPSTDPAAAPLACKDTEASSQANALVCAPYLVKAKALDWTKVLAGDNKLSQTEETTYCEDDPKATYGPELAINKAAKLEGLTQQDLDTFKQQATSGTYTDVTQNYITETSGSGVQSVTGSGVVKSSGGQQPAISLQNGDEAGQVLQWDGAAWKLVTPQSSGGSGLPTSCLNTQAICNKGNLLGATLSLGTQDAQPLSFITSNTERLTVDASGNISMKGNLQLPNNDTMLNFSADDGDKIRLRGTNDESKLGLSGTGGLSLSYYAGNLNQPKTGQHIFNVSKTGSNGWIDRLRINSMGDGNNAAVFFNRDASNSCTVVTGTGWSCSSDERLKKDIAPISDGLSIVQALRSVTFLWKDGDSGLQSGFIAQDVEKVLPQLVSTDANGYKTLSQNGIVPYLVNAIQSQQEEIDTLKQAQQEQQQQIDELRASIRNIQR